jgi:hypothetical protein
VFDVLVTNMIRGKVSRFGLVVSGLCSMLEVMCLILISIVNQKNWFSDEKSG